MASRRVIAKFLAKFIESGSVGRKLGSGRPSKATANIRMGKKRSRLATRGDVMTSENIKQTLPWNGTNHGTEWNGPFYAVFRKTLTPCNANKMYHFWNTFLTCTVSCTS